VRDVKSDVSNTPPDLVSDQYSASSSISCVHKLEELDACVFGTQNSSIDGLHPHAMLMLDPQVVDSTAAPCDDLDGDLYASVNTNADVTTSSHIRGGLLYSDHHVRLAAAQQVDPLPEYVTLRSSRCS
jgi:hypothetical protein